MLNYLRHSEWYKSIYTDFKDWGNYPMLLELRVVGTPEGMVTLVMFLFLDLNAAIYRGIPFVKSHSVVPV